MHNGTENIKTYKKNIIMKRLYIITILIILIQTVGESQPCPEGIVFTSQIQIDNFLVNYPNCTGIEGSVIIEGEDIENLNGLINLVSIGGSLIINGENGLTNFVELNNLTSIGEGLIITLNNSLNSLAGLGNLNYLGALIMRNNGGIINLVEFNYLTSIEGDLWIESCPSLISVEGLDNLHSVGGKLVLSGLNNLSNLSGLLNLEGVGGLISISSNESLISIQELENLININGILEISNNDSLVSLSGLENINSDSISELRIYGNSILSTCEILSVCNYISNQNGDIYIYNNATGCNNETEVFDACYTSIPIQDKGTHTLIYPNPVNNEILFSCNMDKIEKDIIIYNQIGQRVLYKENVLRKLDLSILEKGIYIIEIRTMEKIIRKRIIKE
jgi:hypothetical protein